METGPNFIRSTRSKPLSLLALSAEL